jgi:uncharacterized protein YcaQ
MPTPTVIPNSHARRLLLQRQGLCAAPRQKLDAAGLKRMIEAMGFVQVDSIATVERAHHMILLTDLPACPPDPRPGTGPGLVRKLDP